ncbi:MAG: hypothetical protein ACK5MA_02915 [Parachlamydiaceae bacterium]
MIKRSLLSFLLISSFCSADLCDPYEGCAYVSCREACYIGVGIALGVLMIGGMIAAVGSNSGSSSSHCH